MIGAEVKIWGKKVGGVVWDKDQNLAVFEFGEEFVAQNIDLAPLTMPLKRLKSGERIFSFPTLNPNTFYKLPGLLADSLPDKFGNKLIDIWLAKNGRSPDEFSPVERLCYVGSRAMGALEYSPAIDVKTNVEQVQLSELVEVASEIMVQKETRLANFKTDKEKALKQIVSVGTSAGGMRPKAVIAKSKKNGDILSGNLDLGSEYEYWILKFDGIQDKLLGETQGYGRIEYVYSLIAKSCGINMTDCQLLEENGRAHFMTERFDRKEGRKIHMQTLTGIAHYDYNNIGSTSYEQLFMAMLKLKLGQDELEQMFRRVVFNIVGRNQDDHPKNISFLLEENGHWKLSPAYDLTYNFNPNVGRNTNRHQMSVKGKRENIDRRDLNELAGQFDIKKSDLIIEEVVDAFSYWSKLAHEYDIKDEKIKAISNQLELINE